jgi:hypothetical protein
MLLGTAGLYVTGHIVWDQRSACCGFNGGWSGIRVNWIRTCDGALGGSEKQLVPVSYSGRASTGAKGLRAVRRAEMSGKGGVTST